MKVNSRSKKKTQTIIFSIILEVNRIYTQKYNFQIYLSEIKQINKNIIHILVIINHSNILWKNYPQVFSKCLYNLLISVSVQDVMHTFSCYQNLQPLFSRWWRFSTFHVIVNGVIWLKYEKSGFSCFHCEPFTTYGLHFFFFFLLFSATFIGRQKGRNDQEKEGSSPSQEVPHSSSYLGQDFLQLPSHGAQTPCLCSKILRTRCYQKKEKCQREREVIPLTRLYILLLRTIF